MTPRLVFHTVIATLTAATCIARPTILGLAVATLALILLAVMAECEHRRLGSERRARNEILGAGVAAAVNRAASTYRNVR